jgi:hypothetical protein
LILKRDGRETNVILFETKERWKRDEREMELILFETEEK